MEQAITLICRYFFTVFIRTDYCGLSKDTCNGLNNNKQKHKNKSFKCSSLIRSLFSIGRTLCSATDVIIL